MNEKEFLESLREEVQKAEMPFDERDWEQLRERLDGKKRQKVFPFLLAIPLSWRYAAGGVAAATLLFLGLRYNSGNNDPIENRTVYTNPAAKNIEDRPVDERMENEIVVRNDDVSLEKPKMIPRYDKMHSPPLVPQSGKVNYKETVAVNDSFRFDNSRKETPVPEEEPVQIAVKQEVPIKQVTPELNFDPPVWNEVKLPGRKSVFIAGGGVSYGAQNMGYAVKLGIEKPISNRFSVHTALAVNSNDRNITITEIEKIEPTAIVSNGANYLTFDTTYRQSNRDFAQAFAQALAGIDYKLYSKGKIGMSADAVRLLRSRESLDHFNKELQTDKASSLWNVGLRIQYTQQITPHFDIGTLYRQDISSKINKTWENNFLQLMLIYKVGRKK